MTWLPAIAALVGAFLFYAAVVFVLAMLIFGTCIAYLVVTDSHERRRRRC